MMMAMTVAKMGRSIKNLENNDQISLLTLLSCVCLGRRGRGSALWLPCS
jgi:hypothetical protein